MQVSLIITTYNRPDALAAVLESVRCLRRLPDETIIVDDGSDERTAAVVNRHAVATPRLRHLWQPHDGFRPSRMRNWGIAEAAHDYIVLIDGDMVLHPQFIADHLAYAREGCYLQGVRVPLTARATNAYLNGSFRIRPWHIDGLPKMKYALRSDLLAQMFVSHPNRGLQRIHSCNQSFWRDDLLEANGFDERFNGHGGEDLDLCSRLREMGILQRRLRFTGLAYHLYHLPGQNWSRLARVNRTSERAVIGIHELREGQRRATASARRQVA
jgi:glycosyltransferase involved in cell wall biosynthesis